VLLVATMQLCWVVVMEQAEEDGCLHWRGVATDEVEGDFGCSRVGWWHSSRIRQRQKRVKVGSLFYGLKIINSIATMVSYL
jgi:hypothetical protein